MPTMTISSEEQDDIKNETLFSPFKAYTANNYKADCIFLQLMLNKRKSRTLTKEEKGALVITIQDEYTTQAVYYSLASKEKKILHRKAKEISEQEEYLRDPAFYIGMLLNKI